MAQAPQISPVGRQRQASPERWQKAAQRALAEGISVRQVNASGMWVATSGTHANVAYVLEITGSLVQSCSCPAGTFGDPCCKHAARYYLDAGLLDLDDPEPDPPASSPIVCFRCRGAEAGCSVCQGAGVAPMSAHAAALVGAALAAKRA
jgi:SWIM zinc finger